MQTKKLKLSFKDALGKTKMVSIDHPKANLNDEIVKAQMGEMINSHRLLVRGHRVEYVESVDEELIKENKTNWIFRILFFIALIIIIILLWRIRKLRKENKKTSSKIDQIKEKLDKIGEDNEKKD